MSVQENSEKFLRIPPWLRIKIPCDPRYAATQELMESLNLHTVCQAAKCPNMFECFTSGTATFLILGNTCTRNCAFCNIGGGDVLPLDPEEPKRVAQAAQKLGLKHVVVTSVTRDDVEDGGSEIFAQTIKELRKALPFCTVEVLIPDFQGNESALNTVIAARPEIINHNVETPPTHYSRIRPQANYAQSLELLERVHTAGEISKSGMMVGLGETDDEVRGVIRDLAGIKCDIVTIGQYMRPTRQHPAVERYVHPDVFTEYAEYGKSIGIKHMFCAPLVRSSYNAAQFAQTVKRNYPSGT